MARTIFVSFIGSGNYQPCDYKSWRDDGSHFETKFVQEAILVLYPATKLDKCIILETVGENGSQKKNRIEGLEPLIKDLHNDIHYEVISDDLTKAWEWFEKLQSFFDSGDHLVLDITHGFRIVPIVFSAAVSYLKRVKGVVVDAILYGEREIHKKIFDVSDFFSISDWSEAVGRLVESADPSKLVELSKDPNASYSSFASLVEKETLDPITDLIRAFDDTDLPKIEDYARQSLSKLETIRNKECSNNGIKKQILNLIIDKFAVLVSEPPTNGQYSLSYLKMQLRLIEMYNEHGFYIQCFTAMMEWLGSLGLFLLLEKKIIKKEDFNFLNKKGDQKARPLADAFKQVADFKLDKKFNKKTGNEEFKASCLNKNDKNAEFLKDLFFKHLHPDFIDKLNEIKNNLNKKRNAFDHGWTGEHLGTRDSQNIKKTAEETLKILNELVELVENGKCYKN